MQTVTIYTYFITKRETVYGFLTLKSFKENNDKKAPVT